MLYSNRENDTPEFKEIAGYSTRHKKGMFRMEFFRDHGVTRGIFSTRLHRKRTSCVGTFVKCGIMSLREYNI